MIRGLLGLILGCFFVDQATAASGLTYKTQPTEPALYGITEFGRVRLVLDKNHNGLPDSFEEAFELEPSDNMADADDDSDGLSNKTELAYGTDPSMADTDGDSVSDGAEIENGSSPLDRDDTATTAIPLVSVLVEPRESRLTYNQVFSPPTLDLRLTALLADSTTRDVTSNLQTTYVSLAPSVATVSSSGRVTAIANGTAQIIAQYRGRTDIATVTVSTFAPKPVAAIDTISGFAYRVAVHNGIAYVANGSGGLWVVDVDDPTDPQTLTQVTLGSNDARDVALWGDWAVVANGSYGLTVVNISNPDSPSFLGQLALTDTAQGVAVQDGVAYVAASSAGLVVVDLANPAALSLMPSLDLDGNAHDLAVDPVLHRAVVADDEGAVHVADISVLPPLLLGSVTTGGEPKDVALRGVLAWIAAEEEKVFALDVSQNIPVLLDESRITTAGLVARGVDTTGSLLFVADWGLINNLPIYSIPSASGLALVGAPGYVGQIDFRLSQGNYTPVQSDADHQGVTVSAGFAYVTVGDDGLQIGQYAQFNDAGHVPPRVAIVEPDPDTTWPAGDPIPVKVLAEDDVAVASIELLWDGNVVATNDDDVAPTREITVDIPAPPAQETRVALLEARARDLNGNVGEASPVDLWISPPVDLAAPDLTVLSPIDSPTIAGGRAFLISATATDDHGVAYVEVLDADGIMRDRDYAEPYELVAVMPYEGEVDQDITFTVQAVDYADKKDLETIVLKYGGFSDEIVDSCVADVPVFDLPEEGISGATSGSGLFSGSCGGDGEPERIFAYTVRSDRPLRSLIFSTADELTNYDTVLYVRRDSCANPVAEVADGCDDQSGGNNTSRVTINQPEAGIYYVFVDGSSAGAAGEGAFMLNVSIELSTDVVSFTHVPTDAVWATSVVDRSSEFSQPDWSAQKALGVPDVCACGESRSAWSPLYRESAEDWIEVAFSDVATDATGVYVHETLGSGTIVSVYVAGTTPPTDSDWIQVFEGTATAGATCDRWVLYAFGATHVEAVRVNLNPSVDYAYNEIDAIGLKVPAEDPCADCAANSTCDVRDWGPVCTCDDGYIGGGPTCVPIADEVVLSHPPSDIDWPTTSLGASSYYSGYPAEKAMAWDAYACDCSDSTSAWSPRYSSNTEGESIAMAFPPSLGPAYGVVVRENLGTGAVVGVDVATTETPGGGCYSIDWQPIFEKTASLGADCPRWVLYPLPGIDLRAVRLRLDTTTIDGYNEIDAIGIKTTATSDCAQGCDANARCADGYSCVCNADYVGDGRLCVPPPVSPLESTVTPTATWANRVIEVSTEYAESGGYSAEQATGSPDFFGCADSTASWSPLTRGDGYRNTGKEWIGVEFTSLESVFSGVWVHETYGPGAIEGVDIALSAQTDVCGDADWHSVYEGQASATGVICPRWVLYDFPPMAGIAGVRLRLNTAAAPGWQEIEAIGLKPYP